MKRLLIGGLLTALAALGATAYLGLREDDSGGGAKAAGTPQELAAQGAYLARAGNCMACHTPRGSEPYAGGRPIQTPFGAIYSSNITPDKETGIGNWSADDFWRAIHNGKSRDGRLLYPAFPYTNYTRVSRADADALFAYLQTLPAVKQPNREPELRFPYKHRALLAAWRALYFRPGVFEPVQARGAEWNRGAYLVQGLGHCSACHTARNALGATLPGEEFGGAVLPSMNWYAPSLVRTAEAGLGDWETRDIASLLRTGVSMRGVASGPMAEVVQQSLQHLSEADIGAMSAYLKSLPPAPAEKPPAANVAAQPENQAMLNLGAAIYEKQCVDCHRADGKGKPPHLPALAGNRAVTSGNLANPLYAILHGGYPPSTQGNPRPAGMPPFAAELNDGDVAAVFSYIRNSWGNQASMVSSAAVSQYRSVPLD